MGLVTSCILAIIFFSCTESNGVISLDDNELFSLEYGNFEDQLNLFSLASPSPVRTSLAMRDGFFYIANGEAQKVL